MSKKTADSTNKLELLIQTVADKYVPDQRVEVYSIKVIETDKEITLKGETSNKLAHEELISEATKINSLIKDSIRILPDEVIGTNNRGVIYNSVANLRSKPSYRSEMVTQVLLGMPVRILDKSESWLRIQTPEGYIGWMSGSVQRMAHEELKDYLAKPQIIITSQYAISYSQANVESQPVSDIAVGNMLSFDGEEKDFYKVAYPDGRKAFVKKQDAKELKEWLKEIELTGESIVKTAKQLMGVPYVWGGTSSKGLDCSGFTKTVYWLHGLVIARDASQQIKYGVEVDNNGTFEDVQLGDLVFFGTKATEENPKERVVHVGIYIGNKQFIHASDHVRINSFDPNSDNYDKNNTNRYLRTMRYIGSEGTPGITPIAK